MIKLISIIATVGALSGAPDRTDITPRLEFVQSGLAESMCSAYQPVVENAIIYGQQGLPISTAERAAESALKTDPRLWSFLIESIRVAYNNPNEMSRALRDGRWLSLCVQAIT